MKKHFLDLNNFPLPYSKLTELINIQLIKLIILIINLKFNIKGYELNLNSKFFCKDEGKSLRLTEKEIEIILYLNETKTVET